jgi:cell division protein FtsZ
MREGPLAALFRRTEEEEAQDGAKPAADAQKPEQPQDSAPQAPARSSQQPSAAAPASEAPATPPPATPAAQERSAPPRRAREAAAQQREARATQRPEPEARAPREREREREPEPEAPAHPRETGYPHPSLGASPEPVPFEEPRVPTPRERLRHAFSSDIPEDIMEAPDEAFDPDPEADALPYPRVAADEPTPWGHAKPVGQPILRVVGVGGAGVNAVNRMVEAGIEGIEFLAVNTDLQSLQQSTADITLHIGPQVTRGLGAGANPELGRAAALDEYDRIKALLKGSDMIFIAAGAGGGTGTGAAPVVARIAREVGALAVGIVTRPFGFEGQRRAQAAETGIQALAAEVDTLIVVPNNRLLTVLDKQTSMMDAFRVADDVLRQGVQGISDLVTLPGLINLDFADVRTIMSEAGNALLGIGMGHGEGRAVQAAQTAVSSPLLETSMEGARSILLSITGGSDLSLWEVNEAAKAVSEAAHPDANIIFGAMVDESLDEQVWVTVVATGYGDAPRPSRRALQEPAGEPRVERRAPAERTRRIGSSELEVPEFMPRV